MSLRSRFPQITTACALISIIGCVPLSQDRISQLADSPAVHSRLQLMSAGHTGCHRMRPAKAP
jgi:hypothetical protein